MIILLTIFAAIITSNAFATIAISGGTVTCNPVNPANQSCYRDSTYALTFLLNDTNFTNTYIDGNAQFWKSIVKYCEGCDCGTTLTPVDANLRATTVCDTNGSTDRNFNRSRLCHVAIPRITSPTINNGSQCFDLNVTQCAGSLANCVAGKVNSDKNASLTFTVNNALMSTGDQSLLGIVPIALVAAVIITVLGMVLVVRTGMGVALLLPGLVGLLVALIVIAIFLTLISTGS